MMNKKIKSLTKIFLIDYIKNLKIKKNKKINWKSSITWLSIILEFCIIYLSFKAIDKLQHINKAEMFLQIYLPIFASIIILQLILMTSNIFYYSKDLEYILPMPIETIEILIAKLITIITIIYIYEAIFLVCPLLLYGILVVKTIRYFIYSIFILLIFPFIFTTIISILVMIMMKLLRKIKKKDIIQSIIIIVLIALLGIFIFLNLKYNLNNYSNIDIIQEELTVVNKYYIIINPAIKLLNDEDFINNIKNIIEIIVINSLFVLMFIFIGKKLYFNNLQIVNVEKTKKKIKKYNYKKIKKEMSYLKLEIKKIFKDKNYFIQTTYNYLTVVLVFLILIYIFTPLFINAVKDVTDEITNNMKIEIFLFVIAIIQIISIFNNLSITSISKDGKDAKFMKYIPISLYKQFAIRCIPQVLSNLIMIIMVLVTIYIRNINIEFYYYILAFITAMLFNIINSIIMLLVDCLKPNLNWISIESIFRENNKKVFQYAYIIISVLCIIYIGKIIEEIPFENALILLNVFLLIVIIILNIIIKKNINKILKKIN